ncbi:MAG TPA: 50S ribosomal protein L25 [Kiritimatiellia bacterium]|nr:50S ribosomal protein L25 [Kiritimatiellia bacterium]
MATAVKISAEPRTAIKTNENKRLRKTGWFPGVVYGAGKDVQLVKVNEKEFVTSLHGHASEHLMLDLEIKGQETKKVLLQEVQHDSLRGGIVHADFHEVSMTETLRVEIPLELDGTPYGVATQGGVLEHLLREVEIECLPGDLMEVIHLDVSAMKIGDVLTVGDVTLDPDKFKIITDADLPVAAVAAPTVEEATPAAGTGTEPEVIKEKKPDEKAG